ncbi:hypothetical protein [Desulforamulus aquiferis]|uniref:PEP-CTERM protein-sorting domain-containing protein n=1 Tax=Desulforamulus aquiferis TaxID=1397668 RepID=A0AAW7ZEM4_9FIRM|nr:hypothetical protein [Desulforamulus aquiferis]MDO7787461.1 hypothetical protein [Desulforamulus aquiferis]RYD05422.1 hypothetical protein N752_08745 [Desulforamulus aquiferis]
MKRKYDWKFIVGTIGFILIGVSIIFPEQSWILIFGAVLFAVGMFRRKPKKKR